MLAMVGNLKGLDSTWWQTAASYLTPAWQRAASILDMDGDTFMRTDSKADKWLILELPQVIRPDTLRVSACAITDGRSVAAAHLHAGSDGIADTSVGACNHLRT